MIQVRAATVKDAEVISGLVCRCYEGFEQTDGWPHDVVTELKAVRGSADCIRELIARERVFVAEDGGSVLGAVSIRENEVTKLFVNPIHQRQGIGRRLFAHAESFIRDQGYGHMLLGAAVQTPIAFYKKMGMDVTRTQVIDHGPCVGMISTVLEKSIETC